MAAAGQGRRVARSLLPALCALMLPAMAAADDFLLTIEGSTLRRFYLNCRLVEADGSVQRVERTELTPQRYAISADAVSCTISLTDPRGRLSARLSQGRKLIAQASVNAIYGRVRVFSAGPWGAAGSRTDARSFPFTPKKN